MNGVRPQFGGGGHRLGLALVSTIVDAYAGLLTLHANPIGRLTATLSLER